MASLLERLKYIIEDIFGKKTYAESQRDKYKKVVRNNLDLIEYDIIPDNKFTENKTVVYDTPGTEKTTVNTVDYLKEYQAVTQEELEQMIVFPGSKKAESSQAAD